MQKYLQLLEAQSKSEKLAMTKLPYDVGDLEPVLSKENVKFHLKLTKGYVDRFNQEEGDPDFNWGGAKLHELWWMQLQAPQGANKPKGAIKEFIEQHFKTWDDFQEAFTLTAMGLQGSGWCYLSKKGEIKTLKNQDYRSEVLMGVDMWEHSWAFGFESPDKPKYLKNIWKIINWDVISARLS